MIGHMLVLAGVVLVGGCALGLLIDWQLKREWWRRTIAPYVAAFDLMKLQIGAVLVPVMSRFAAAAIDLERSFRQVEAAMKTTPRRDR